MNQAMTDKNRLLNDIGIVGFTLVDLALYLDTHPFDQDALNYFNHYSRIQKQLKREFASKYYPLTAIMSSSSTEWEWGLAPLPWEGGC